MSSFAQQSRLVERNGNEVLLSIFDSDNKKVLSSDVIFTATFVQQKNNTLSFEAAGLYLKINSFETLEENWDSYGASPPSHQTIENAILVLRFLDYRDVSIYHVVPTPGGGIGIEIVNHENEKSIELEIQADETIEYGCFIGDDLHDEGIITMIEKREVAPIVKINSPLQDVVAWLH